ncbi:Nse4 C-terminal-domain-containing protein [Thamnidium elegans]|nr:Nse4 C-terminal-domain-containing protein [Thamnidium elegans]
MGPARDQGLLEVKEIVEKGTDREEYDPKQCEEERRELRIKYRQLTEEALEKRRELVAQDSGDGLLRFVSKSNVLFKNVKNTQEAVLDSKFLVLASDLNSQKTQSIQIGDSVEVNLDELVAKVITFSSEGPNHIADTCLDWELIGQKASTFGKRVHTMDFMLGPLSFQRKELKRTRTGKLTKNKEDLVMPTKLKESDIKEQENETSNNVNTIYQILSQVGPVNYFKFVTNPESFSQTVENIFYVSFLARSGVVGISTETGQPILDLRDAPNVTSIEDVVNKKQIIMGIDIKDWNDIVKTFKITKSYIPTRQFTDKVAGGTEWY